VRALRSEVVTLHDEAPPPVAWLAFGIFRADAAVAIAEPAPRRTFKSRPRESLLQNPYV